MQRLQSFISFKVSVLTFVGVFMVVGSVLALAPRQINQTKAENCYNAPEVATLNPFPVSWDSTTGSDCTDAPFVAIRNANGGSYAQSATAQVGEELRIRVYVHNGAQQGLDTSLTTALGVNGGMYISGNNISLTATASRGDGNGGYTATNSLNGSVSANVPSGASLEMISGSEEFYDYQANRIYSGSASFYGQSGVFDMQNMEACFEFSKFFVFRVKVVGEVVNPNPPANPGTGWLTASLAGTVPNQCLYKARVQWDTENISQVLVTVSNPSLNSDNYFGNDLVFSYSPNSDEIVEWISPGDGYRFTLWEVNPASGGQSQNVAGQNLNVKHIAEQWVTGGNDDFCQTSVPELVCAPGSQNAKGNDIVFFTAQGGDDNQNFNWSAPGGFNQQGNGRSFHVTYPAHANGNFTVTVSNGSQTANCSVQVSPLAEQNTNYTLQVFDQNNVLKDNGEFCVGDTPQYKITSNPSIAGSKILWSSRKDNVQTGEYDADYGFTLNSEGSWSEWGSTWNSSHIGDWEKQSNVNYVLKTVKFKVKNCSAPPPPPAVCPTNAYLTVSSSSIKVGEHANVYAPSGWNNGSFSSSNSSVASVSGSSIRGVSQGSVSISGSGWTAPNGAVNCALGSANITVTQTPPPPAVCPTGAYLTISPTSIKVDEYANVYAPSGWSNGSFSSSNSSVASVSGSSIRGVAQGSASISGSGFTAPNGATNCALGSASITVTYTPPPAECPTNVSVRVSPSNIYVNDFATASAPAGFSNGYFTSSNPSVASLVDGARGNSIKGLSAGTAYVSGANWTAPNGAVNCALISDSITVSNRPIQPPVEVTATATATASATAYASCPDGTRASASASASATATATASTRGEAERLAYEKAFAQAEAMAYAQAEAKVVCRELPPPPPPQLTCSPIQQTADVNQVVNFSANGGNGSYTWTANGGTQTTGTGIQFSTRYSQGGSKVVSVTSGNQTQNCYVQVNQVQSERLTCLTLTPEVDINQNANFRATGGASSTYNWQALGGSPVSGNGRDFSSKFTSAGFKTVFVQNGNETESCSVRVKEPVQTSAEMELVKTVRNINDNTEFSHNVSAKQNDRVEYKIFVRALTSTNLRNVRVTDEIPLGLTPESGSLKVDGQSVNPGLTSGGLVFENINQSGITITYRATVHVNSGTLTNLARATSDNAQSKLDRANVTVVPVVVGQPTLSITKEVRNLGPSQTTGFTSSVNAKKNDTVQYRITVRNVGSATANNVVLSDASTIINSATNLNVSKTYSGTLQSGLNLGSLSAGENVVITYNANVSIEQGEIRNTATVSASNASTERAIALVNVIKDNEPPVNPPGGTTTIVNTCVNNSCNNTNVVYINQTGGTVPGNEYRQLAITKLVRSTNSGAFQDSVNVNNNDTVEFEIVVRNSGNQVINNVVLNDTWNGNMTLVSGSVRVDGNNFGDNINSLNLGSILSGQQKRVVFQARVNSGSNQSIQNTAKASGEATAQVQDDAWVFVQGQVQGGSVSLAYSKKAVNETKNTEATSVIASREDYITYTLTVTNSGNTLANNFVITDDLSQVLPYADMVDNGGGSLSGNILSYPGISIPAGGSVSKSFKVRVKFSLAANLSYTMTNTYGNTLSVRINTPQVLGAFVAPKTGGPSVALASAFGAIMVAGMAVVRNRKKVLELIWS